MLLINNNSWIIPTSAATAFLSQSQYILRLKVKLPVPCIDSAVLVKSVLLSTILFSAVLICSFLFSSNLFSYFIFSGCYFHGSNSGWSDWHTQTPEALHGNVLYILPYRTLTRTRTRTVCDFRLLLFSFFFDFHSCFYFHRYFHHFCSCFVIKYLIIKGIYLSISGI